MLLKKKDQRLVFFKTDIDAFPSLFEASIHDRDKVLEFVKNVSPEIDLGYENTWQKAAKSRA